MQGGKGLQPYLGKDAKDPRNRQQSFRTFSLPKILEHVKPRHRFSALDIGCGNGRMAACLAEHFREVVAIDPNVDPEPFFICANTTFEKTTWQEFRQSSSDTFNLILFWGSFYLFADEGAETLASCAHFLSEEGVIVIADDLRRNTDREVDPIDDGLIYSLSALRGDLREVDEFIQDDYLRVTVLKR